MAARKKAASAGTRSGRVSKRTRGKLAPGGEARGLDAAQVAIALESPEIADLAAIANAEYGLATPGRSSSVPATAAHIPAVST